MQQLNKQLFKDCCLSAAAGGNQASANTVDGVDISGREIGEVAADALTGCPQLHKLNLANNQLHSTGQLCDALAHVPELSFLNLSNNRFSGCKFVRQTPKLTGTQNTRETLKPHLMREKVLNMSHNQLQSIPEDVKKLCRLRALILNNNRIKTIENVESLSELNTLVISHNEISLVPRDLLVDLDSLTKLSISHNHISDIDKFLTVYNIDQKSYPLKELRMNNNKISRIPEQIKILKSLEILDFGSNCIEDYEDLKALASLSKLSNLNLKGNPICNKPDYSQTVRQMIPSLRILDGNRFDKAFLKRKEKRKNTGGTDPQPKKVKS